MRKILLIVIIFLLLALGYVTLVNGLDLISFHVSSIKEVENESKSLKAKIEEVNTLIDVDYPKKISELRDASNKMKSARSEYLEYTNLSSDEEILAARTEKSYAIEFLWAKVGTHARREGINLKLEILSSSTGANNANDLGFTVQGSYIAITNFIYAIENDSDLDFRIQNFKLLPYQKEILEGTFKVYNIGIQGNTSSQTIVETQNPEQEQEENETENQNQEQERPKPTVEI